MDPRKLNYRILKRISDLMNDFKTGGQVLRWTIHLPGELVEAVV